MPYGSLARRAAPAISAALSGSFFAVRADKKEEQFQRAVVADCRRLGFQHCHFDRELLEQMATNADPKVWCHDSPERRGAAPSVGFEPTRSMLRHQRYQILLKNNISGSLPDDREEEEAYQQFTMHQPEEVKLTRDDFKALRGRAWKLSQFSRKVLHVTAVLKPSVEMIEAHKAAGYDLPKDSEEMLTIVTCLAANKKLDLVPAINALTPAQRHVLKSAYPADCHMRHILFGEACLSEIRSVIRHFNKGKLDFQMLYFRWIIDLCGFDQHQCGLTHQLFVRFNHCVELLQQASRGEIEPEDVMPAYLSELARTSVPSSCRGFYDLSPRDRCVVALLMSYYEHIDVVHARAVVKAYNAFKEGHGDALTMVWIDFSDRRGVQAPTYLPAVLKTAELQFEKSGLSKEKAITAAARITFDVLEKVYTAIIEKPRTKISARDFAWYQNWEKEGWAEKYLAGELTFDISEGGDVVAVGMDKSCRPSV